MRFIMMLYITRAVQDTARRIGYSQVQDTAGRRIRAIAAVRSARAF